MTSVVLTTYHVKNGIPTGERTTHDVTPVLDSYHLDQVRLLTAPAAFVAVVQQLKDAGLAETVFDRYTYEVSGWNHYVASREAAGEFGPISTLNATPEVVRQRVGELFSMFQDGIPSVTLVSGPKDGVARQRVARHISELKTSYDALSTDEQASIHANDQEWLDKLFAAPIANGDYHPKKHPEVIMLVAEFFDYLRNRERLFEESVAEEALNRYRESF